MVSINGENIKRKAPKWSIFWQFPEMFYWLINVDTSLSDVLELSLEFGSKSLTLSEIESKWAPIKVTSRDLNWYRKTFRAMAWQKR